MSRRPSTFGAKRTRIRVRYRGERPGAAQRAGRSHEESSISHPGHDDAADDAAGPRTLEDGRDRAGETGVIVGHYGVAVDVRLDGSDACVSMRVRRGAGHVVGERVEIVAGGLRSLDAQRVLRRRDPRGRLRPVAAGLDLLGVVVAPRPETPLGFVDRACVGALAAGIEPVIVVNKADREGARATYEAARESWGASLRVLLVSAHTGEGQAELAALFAPGKRGAFVGTSGVGKSSLANALCPSLALETGEINEQSGQGRHVTTNATLHALPGGGELVDTPGFRDFGPVEVSALELSQGFIGFSGVVEEACRFRDCRHRREPGCAVLAALEAGRLSGDRYRVYCSLLDDVEAVEREAGTR